jgi:hypothetical protein
MRTKIHKTGDCQLTPKSVSLIKVSDSTYIYEIDMNRMVKIEIANLGTGNDEEQGVSVLPLTYNPDSDDYEPCEILFVAETPEEKKIIGGLHYCETNKNSIMGTFIIANHPEEHECIIKWDETEEEEIVV